MPQPVITPATAHVSPARPASVSITVPLDGIEIHYTLDGSEPTVKSPLYTEELSISGNKILKARAFHPVRLPSVIATAYYSQSLPVAEVIYFNPPAKNRIGAGEDKTLIDLVKARPEASDENWEGYEGDDLKVVLDLGEKETFMSWNSAVSKIIVPVSSCQPPLRLSFLWMGKNLRPLLIKNYLPRKPEKHVSQQPETWALA